jgi:hypothetical protein
MPRRRRAPYLSRFRRLARIREWTLMYRISRWGAVALVVALAAAVTFTAITGLVVLGSMVAGTTLLAWLAFTLRVVRLLPAGPPRGDGPAPPGGAAVREPRRPLPLAPAGAAAVPLPDEDSRQGLAALG